MVTEKVSGALVKSTDTVDYRVYGTDGSETEATRTATDSLLAPGATFTEPVHGMGEEVVTGGTDHREMRETDETEYNSPSDDP